MPFSSSPHLLHFLAFRTGPLRCALPVSCVREIVHMPATVAIPAQPPLLLGFLNYHGEPIPVVRLRRLFGLQLQTPGLHTPVLLIDTGGAIVALSVDRADELLSVDPSSVRPVAPEQSINACVEAQLESHGEPILLLSAEALLLEGERQMLDAYRSQVQQRLDEVHPIAE